MSTFAIEYQHLIDFPFLAQILTFWSVPTLLHSNVNFLIDSPLFTQNTTFWTIWWLVLKFQHFDWFPVLSSFHSNWTFWSNFLFHSNFSILIDLTFFTQISAFWSTWHFALKFQHFDRFLMLSSNFNILINNILFQSNSNNLIDFHFCNRISTFDRTPLFCSNFNILIDLTFCTQISTLWSISTLLHTNVNFLIDSPLFTHNTSFWTIWWLALEFQHFGSILNVVLKFQYSDQFLIFQSNSNNLIDFYFCNRRSTFDRSPFFAQISTFWSIWHLALKFQHFDQFHLIALKCQLFDWFPTFHSKYNIFNDLVISTQISAFWLIPNFVFKFQCFIDSPLLLKFDILIDLPFSLKFQHFDGLDILHSLTTFWSILNVVLKFQRSDHFLIFQLNSNILINSHFGNKISTFDQSPPFTQISTFWLIIVSLKSNWHFALKFQHFDRFLMLSSNFNILINSLFFNQIPIIW